MTKFSHFLVMIIASCFMELAAGQAFRRVGTKQTFIAENGQPAVIGQVADDQERSPLNERLSCKKMEDDQMSAMKKAIPEFHIGQKLLHGGSDTPYVKKWLKLAVNGTIPSCLKCVVVGDGPS